MPREALCCKVVCFNKEKIEGLRKKLLEADALVALSERYKAMAHPSRLAVLRILALEECCVCDLANILSLPVSTLSQHLRVLKSAGLIKSRQEGKLIFYSLTEFGREVDIP